MPSSRNHGLNSDSNEGSSRWRAMQKTAGSHGSPCWIPFLESITSFAQKSLLESLYARLIIGWSEGKFVWMHSRIRSLRSELKVLAKSNFTRTFSEALLQSVSFECISARHSELLRAPETKFLFSDSRLMYVLTYSCVFLSKHLSSGARGRTSNLNDCETFDCCEPR